MSEDEKTGYLRGPNGDDIRAYLKSLFYEDRDRIVRSTVFIEPDFETEKINEFFARAKAMLHNRGVNRIFDKEYDDLCLEMADFVFENMVTDPKKLFYAVDETVLKSPEVAKRLTRSNVNIVRNACIQVLGYKEVWPKGSMPEIRNEKTLDDGEAIHFDNLGAPNLLGALIAKNESTRSKAGLVKTKLNGEAIEYVDVESKDGVALAEDIKPADGSLQLITGQTAHARPEVKQDLIDDIEIRQFFRKSWNLKEFALAVAQTINKGVDENFAQNLIEQINHNLENFIGDMSPTVKLGAIDIR